MNSGLKWLQQINDGLPPVRSHLPCHLKWCSTKGIKWSLVFNVVHDNLAYVKASTACSHMEWCPIIHTPGVLVFCFFEKELKKLYIPIPGVIMKGGSSFEIFWALVLGIPQVEAGNLDSFLLVTGTLDQQQDTWILLTSSTSLSTSRAIISNSSFCSSGLLLMLVDLSRKSILFYIYNF